MKYIIDVPDSCKPKDVRNNFHFIHVALVMAFENANEAMPIDVPEGFCFSGILEKDGAKTDWQPLEVYAVKPRPAASGEEMTGGKEIK